MFTYDEERLSETLDQLKIHELREVGDFVGVRSPSSFNFEPLKREIIGILMGEKALEGKSNRGRPRKSGQIGAERFEQLLGPCRIANGEVEYQFAASMDRLNQVREAAPVFDEVSEEREGILETFVDGYGFVRTRNFEPSDMDAYLSNAQIKRFGLRRGDVVRGKVKSNFQDKYAAMYNILAVNGENAESLGKRVNFDELVPVYPDRRLVLSEAGEIGSAENLALRFAELFAPVGFGQRGLIIAPPNSGKTTFLKQIARSLRKSHPEVSVIVLLIDGRPEETTDFVRSTDAEVIRSDFDEPASHHVRAAELALDRAKRLAERKQDVVILLDSLTRLARAYRTSGGSSVGVCEDQAMFGAKKFFGSARNFENGGSLTILATALIETGNPLDGELASEFRSEANMELRLVSRGGELPLSATDARKIPLPADVRSSGTQREDLLLPDAERKQVQEIRSIFAQANPEQIGELLQLFCESSDNREFLKNFGRRPK